MACCTVVLVPSHLAWIQTNEGLDEKTGIFWIECSGANQDSAIYYVSNAGSDDGEGEKIIGLFFEESSNYIIKNLKVINYTDIGIGFSQGSNLVLTHLEIVQNGHQV